MDAVVCCPDHRPSSPPCLKHFNFWASKSWQWPCPKSCYLTRSSPHSITGWWVYKGPANLPSSEKVNSVIPAPELPAGTDWGLGCSSISPASPAAQSPSFTPRMCWPQEHSPVNFLLLISISECFPGKPNCNAHDNYIFTRLFIYAI